MVETKPVLHRLDSGRLIFWCQACQTHHYIQVEGAPKWDWNGDMVKPTVSPSIRVRGVVPLSDAEISLVMVGVSVETKEFQCHLWVKDGVIQYCNDCIHPLSGQNIPMIPFDEV